MNRLARRVERLESGRPSDEVLVWAAVPEDWTQERREREGAALAIKNGYEAPFSFYFFPQDPKMCGELRPVFIGTDSEFSDHLEEIQRSRRLITPRPVNDAP